MKQLFNQGSLSLYRQVRSGFIQKGMTFSKWCREHGYDRAHATRCLKGERNGLAAKSLRHLIFEEAQK